MNITRSASVTWRGGVRDGKGAISTQSGILQSAPYGFVSRFEGKPGTNPEELIAAAHAGCFTMALSLMLGQAGLTVELLETAAKVTLEADDGYTITRIDLNVSARIPGADAEQFQTLAERAKAECPVSKLFNAPITLKASLVA